MSDNELNQASGSVWPRTDAKELSDFDERSKRCTMNCGQHTNDPRSRKEMMYQCDDCENVSPSAQPVYGVFDPDYARFFTKARCLAWSEGYALCVHGSFTRDLDLIAIPWTDRACDPAHLVKRMTWESKDVYLNGDEPSVREHGRLCWTLGFKAFADPRWIDFSIIPPNGEEADA